VTSDIVGLLDGVLVLPVSPFDFFLSGCFSSSSWSVAHKAGSVSVKLGDRRLEDLAESESMRESAGDPSLRVDRLKSFHADGSAFGLVSLAILDAQYGVLLVARGRSVSESEAWLGEAVADRFLSLTRVGRSPDKSSLKKRSGLVLRGSGE